ncbi:MAG TPA: hypothetical protein VK969_08135 [Acidimicrobiia bacterium]|nr:hypothetical protein [Acidimicrobiia bacterium]
MVVLAVLLAVSAVACSGSGSPVLGEEPEPVPAIEDGEWFAFVIVGEDESGAMTLGVDLADMLTGEEARQAAIADGVIGEDEDLPNDFYIDNPAQVYELLHLAGESEIVVLSGTDPGEEVRIDADQLAALYEGEYAGEPVYGVVAGEPIAMNVTVADGVITVASMVYLP